MAELKVENPPKVKLLIETLDTEDKLRIMEEKRKKEEKEKKEKKDVEK
jgi:hypothetical protein